MSTATYTRTLCGRCGIPLTERALRGNHEWCVDCREVEADLTERRYIEYPTDAALTRLVEAQGVKATATFLGINKAALYGHLRRQGLPTRRQEKTQ